MNRQDFIDEINSYYPSQKLEAVKLIKNVSGLGLRVSKDLADNYFTNKSSGIRIAEILETNFLVKFTIKVIDKTSLSLQFIKLQLTAKNAGLEKYFEYLCEITLDENFPRNIELEKPQEDKRSDEVTH